MARIAGVNIPTNKRVLIGLRYIYGIGPSKAAEICGKLKIPAGAVVNIAISFNSDTRPEW